ncbi:MAG: hypothetical protein RJB60_2890 [Pseudomonadota bacterium]
MVSLFASGRAALSVLALCALTACGGGGDSGVTAKEGELIVIDAGSSGLAVKTYKLDTTYGPSYATYGDLPMSGRVVKIEPENSDFDTGLAFVQGKPSKFIVGFGAQVAGAAMGTYKDFACRSSAWTDAELVELGAASLPVCTQAITIDETKRIASYINLSLPAEESGGKALIISATFSWPVPVSRVQLNGSSIIPGSGSGSGSASFGPVTSTTSGSTLIANPGATLGSNVTTAPAVAGGGSIAISAPPSPATPTTPRTAGSIEVTTAGGSTGTTSLPSAPAAPGTVAATSN